LTVDSLKSKGRERELKDRDAEYTERRLTVDPSTPLRAGSLKSKGKERELKAAKDGDAPTGSASSIDSLKLKGEGKERAHPRVFCERVRNRLMAKSLGKHSFLESAEGYENRGVNFVRFAAKSEKSEGAEIGWAPSKLRVKGRALRVRSLRPSSVQAG